MAFYKKEKGKVSNENQTKQCPGISPVGHFFLSHATNKIQKQESEFSCLWTFVFFHGFVKKSSNCTLCRDSTD